MTTLMSNLAFNGMSLFFKVRDLITPRREVLEEAELGPGDWVLDYGCGPGAYVPDVAEMVEETGQVYALDIHPLAIKRVQSTIEKRALTNVETIHSDCHTGLPNECLDVVLLYDVFHALSDPQAILAELHRVLKPDGTLSFSDHHMGENEIIAGVTKDQLFQLARKGEHTCSFLRQER
ncbi:MAG: class I SAM-dependent methyltransferase [Chloroflexota bacterium]|nr:class I SAM-dependent methyltransferase [Chloroflexota bacterium]